MIRVNRLGLSKDQKVSALGLKKVDDTDKSYLANCIWCDKNGNEIKALSFNTNEIYIKLTFKNITLRNPCKIIIQKGNNVVGDIYNEVITKEVFLMKVNLKDILDNSNYEITNFQIRFLYKKTFTESDNLKVHFVIFIPEIMEKLKWTNAARVQREWFNNIENNYPWEANPRLNFYDIEWALGFKRFKKFFDENFNDWKSENGIKSLRDEIKKMIKNKFVDLPSATNKETKFGVYDNDNKLYIKTIKPEELNKKDTPCPVPLYDLYYFSSMQTDEKKGFEESKFDPELDDFYGAIANTSVRIIASGILKYENNKINVIVKKIGFYIRDNFDYVGDQRLGNWTKKSVSNNLVGSGINIDNESYRKYREDVGMGQDFYTYSTIKYYVINDYSFEL